MYNCSAQPTDRLPSVGRFCVVGGNVMVDIATVVGALVVVEGPITETKTYCCHHKLIQVI